MEKINFGTAIELPGLSTHNTASSLEELKLENLIVEIGKYLLSKDTANFFTICIRGFGVSLYTLYIC